MGNFGEVFRGKGMKSVEDYRQGFLDGMSADQKCPQILMIMGKTFDEILKLILKDEENMATISMTRREAEAKLFDARIPRDISGNYQIIDVLQALGLLHIQEEKAILNVTNLSPVIIKRHGKIVYEE